MLAAEIMFGRWKWTGTLNRWFWYIIFSIIFAIFIYLDSLFFLFLFLFILLFLLLLVVISHQSFGLLLHHLHTNRTVLLCIDLIGFLNYSVIFLSFVFLLTRKYLSKPSQMFVLVFISHSLGFFYGDLTLFSLINLPLACYQPLLIYIFHFIIQLVLLLNINIQNIQSILY